jgi:hypothetical protein
MRCQWLRQLSCIVALLTAVTAVQAEDLHLKKSISVGGNVVSTSESSIKGARTREVNQGPGGGMVTIKQCDLKRTVSLNDQTQTYFVANDPQDAAAARAAAMLTGAPVPEEKTSGGKIEVTTTLTDTGERKQLFGYTARHLKAKVIEKSSADACSKVDQTFDMDGWYADIGGKEQSSCGASVAPPVHQTQGCQDAIVEHHSGSGKLGYPLVQNVIMHNSDGSPMTVNISVTELNKQPQDAALFDVPSSYKQVNSFAELQGVPQAAPMTQMAQQPQPTGQGFAAGPNNAPMGNPMGQQMMSQFAAQSAMAQGHMSGMPGMGMGGNQPGGAPVAPPQALGPKAAGKIRIGVAPPDAQVGQGNNATADYSTPIRNAMILLMNGPAIEIAALDSRIAMQLQAEAQQKQCDYILYSAIAVKHPQSSGFGKFAKMAAPMAQMTPMGAMAHGVGGAMAASAASAAASAAAQSAQQQAMNQVMSQLSGFNGQIKSKDNVTVQYQLAQTGATTPILQNELQGKAKSDGEDVLTPLLQQTANTVLTQVSTKK